jgi:hypothetical protein
VGLLLLEFELLDGHGALGFLVSSWRLWESQESLVYTVRDPPFRRWRTDTLSGDLSLGDVRGSNTLRVLVSALTWITEKRQLLDTTGKNSVVSCAFLSTFLHLLLSPNFRT